MGLNPQKAPDVPLINKGRLVWLARQIKREGTTLTLISFHKIELLHEIVCKLHFNGQERLIVLIHVTLGLLRLVSSEVGVVVLIHSNQLATCKLVNLQVSTKKLLLLARGIF